MGIVVFGAVFVDIKGYPFMSYMPSGRNVGRVEQVHGGVSRNVAEDIANIGLHPVYVSLVDDNGTGQDVVNALQESHVDTRYMSRTKDGMGTWLAIFDHNGDVVASISNRPDLSKIGEILKYYGDEIFSACDSVVLEIDMEYDLVQRIFSLASRYHKAVYAVVSNMGIAVQRRELLRSTDCIVCNRQEAGILFSEDYSGFGPDKMEDLVRGKVNTAGFRRMVITMGANGAVYAGEDGEYGYVPAVKVDVKDTTGAGDAFFSGVTVGLTYGKTLREACLIGTRLAASVITSYENVCPKFLPGELGLDIRSTD